MDLDGKSQDIQITSLQSHENQQKMTFWSGLSWSIINNNKSPVHSSPLLVKTFARKNIYKSTTTKPIIIIFVKRHIQQ